MSEPNSEVHVQLDLVDGAYGIQLSFPQGNRTLLVDEPEPLGRAAGPNASAVLGSAVAACLSASLLFCMRKSHVDVGDIRTDATIAMERNERGRLRISRIKVDLHPVLDQSAEGRLARCADLFEDFCVVTESVRKGIEVEVELDPVFGAERAEPQSLGG